MEKPKSGAGDHDHGEEPSRERPSAVPTIGRRGCVPSECRAPETGNRRRGVRSPAPAGSEITSSWIRPETRNASKVAPAIPKRRTAGRKTRRRARSLKAAFQRWPQNSLTEVERSGAFMIGGASTRNARQPTLRRWKKPKWSSRTIPTIPIQPARRGSAACRAIPKSRNNPSRIRTDATAVLPNSR